MSLTDEDLDKIQAVVSAGVELTKTYVDERISKFETTVMTKVDGQIMQTEVVEKIEQVKTMLQGDHSGLGRRY